METATASLELTDLIRTTVRTTYDLQQTRIQNGNRIAGNFRARLKTDVPEPEKLTKEEQDELAKQVLKRLKVSHKRITDAIVKEINEAKAKEIAAGKRLPKEVLTRAEVRKRFRSDDLLTTSGELFLVDNYLNTLRNEEQHFSDLADLLEDVPVYKQFLETIPGLGAAMAGVIISEIDIHKAEYPSSLWKLAGLDVVNVIEYRNNDGDVVKRWSFEQAASDPDIRISFDDKGAQAITYKDIPCEVVGIGRNKQTYSLVKRQYTDWEGNEAIRNSITFSPFLKTKLVGVLAGNLLKASGYRVNGERMSVKRQLALATSLGFDKSKYDEDEVNLDELVVTYLESKGHKVERLTSKYVKVYQDYRARLDHHPKHKSKSNMGKYRMAVRVMIKELLKDLYAVWKRLEGLPASTPYSEGKLGITHGVASEGK
jgi:hypothetical protein